MYSRFIEAGIPLNRIELSLSDSSYNSFISALGSYKDGVDINSTYRPYDVGIIGPGDFGVALYASLRPELNILFYDVEPVRNIFSSVTRISTNRSFVHYFGSNVDFTHELKKVLEARYIILSVPANVIPSMIDKIKECIPYSYKEKQYVLVSKGFIGKGYIPHRWLEKNGISFDNIIWASGGNVAKEVVEKKSFKISVVSINKNKKARREFASFFNKEYLVPLEYSGSALLACELGGILKNYYAGLGRYILSKYGEDVFKKYKYMARSEFRKSVRMVSSSPTVSIRAWVIRKASHGPAFWEDLDVTVRDGRNGFFGEAVFSGSSVAKSLNELGLVESFKTVFSTLSLFNRLSRNRFKRLKILKSILEIYEELHIEYLEGGDAFISEESKKMVTKLERKILTYKPYWFF